MRGENSGGILYNQIIDNLKQMKCLNNDNMEVLRKFPDFDINYNDYIGQVLELARKIDDSIALFENLIIIFDPESNYMEAAYASPDGLEISISIID